MGADDRPRNRQDGKADEGTSCKMTVQINNGQTVERRVDPARSEIKTLPLRTDRALQSPEIETTIGCRQKRQVTGHEP
jgi:hypothetical protein